MNGLLFTEFMEMVETTWSFDMVDTLIDRSQVSSGGIYTAVGSYPQEEMVALINALAEATETPTDQIERAFGKYLFRRIALEYPQYFTGIRDSFQFLARIDEIVHTIVRRHFPDTDPPTIIVEQSPSRLSLTYFSESPFIHLAKGLIEGCISHFGGGEVLHQEPSPDLAGAKARFVLTRPAEDV
jgi:predicted hydrocarbon binding protein